MKKIFAIALALVMVLSMASAFAWCPTISWACDTYTCTNGTGKVEVIPFVKGNACGGNSYTANTCAGAINGDDVYFAVKVTVDADPSEDWWNKAVLSLSLKGLDTLKAWGGTTTGEFGEGYVAGLVRTANEGELKAGEYYIVATSEVANGNVAGWKAVKAADFEAGIDTIFSANVTDASKAKVCAKLTSKAVIANDIEVNGYKVRYDKDNKVMTITKGDKIVWVSMDKDDKVVAFDVKVGAGEIYNVKTYNNDKTAFWATTATKAAADLSWTCTDEGKFLKAVMEYFVLDFGTCVTEKAVKANFGWDAKNESCFSWSDKVQAVVDAECVVAIPKTGDASVLAWLF